MNDDYNLKGKVAVVGVGETTYYKHGQSPDPEFVLVLKAIIAACEDAGISPKEIDGFCSYSNDRNDPPRLANALGIPELRYSNMQWTSGAAEQLQPFKTLQAQSWRDPQTLSWPTAVWLRASSVASVEVVDPGRSAGQLPTRSLTE